MKRILLLQGLVLGSLGVAYAQDGIGATASQAGVSGGIRTPAGTVDLGDLVKRGKMDDLKAAVAAGTSINALNADGLTPLHAAVRYKTPPHVPTLMQLNADPKVLSGEGLTALQMCGKEGRPMVAMELLKAYGPGIANELSAEGWGAIHYAAAGPGQPHASTIRELIDAGVPRDMKTRDGKMALDIAKERGIPAILEFLTGVKSATPAPTPPPPPPPPPPPAPPVETETAAGDAAPPGEL